MSLSLSTWVPPDHGALFVVTGASGTGKTTLVRSALARIPNLHFSVSATTRLPRSSERDGVDYHFLSPAQFATRIDRGEFLEWAEVYDNRYGTLSAPIQTSLETGNSILLDIDTQGAQQVRRAMPTAVSIFILPPSLDALAARLENRGTDADEVISRRMQDATLQLRACGAFDYLIVNDDLECAQDQFDAILVSQLRRTSRNESLVARFTD